MVIEISSAEILHRVRDIAQDELAVSVPDETLRYKIEPGTEKEDKVKTLIATSVAALCSQVWRFLSNETQQEYWSIDNTAEVLPEKYLLDFEVSARRAAGKAGILANRCTKFLVENTLMEYYLSVAQVQLSQNHAQMASLEMKNISSLIYTKALP